MSLARGDAERCVGCGEHSGGITVDAEPFCDECLVRSMAEAHPSSEYYRLLTFDGVGSGEHRFGAEPLFRAARVLLAERISEEDQIIPSLAFAVEMGFRQEPLTAITRRLFRAQESAERWEHESAVFSGDLQNLRPVRVVDGVLILEWNPISVRMHYDIHPRVHPKYAKPSKVAISVYPRGRMPGPEYVTALYEKTLSKAGISYTEQRTGSMRFDYGRGCLTIVISHSYKGQDGPVFVHPGWVGRYYEMLLGKPEGPGFAQFLTQGRRGPAQSPETLIPACVAACLRRHSKIDSRQRIHELLNEHVLCEIGKSLPVIGCSTSETNQLWRDAKRADHRMRVARINLQYPTIVT